MGNTKLVAFEGWCAPDAIPTREQCLELTHGTYCALEIDPKGYLGSDDGGAPCDAFVVGVLYSYSLVDPSVIHTLFRRALVVVYDQVNEETSITNHAPCSACRGKGWRWQEAMFLPLDTPGARGAWKAAKVRCLDCKGTGRPICPF